MPTEPLLTLIEEVAATLDNVMGVGALGDDAVQVVPYLNLSPSEPAIDIYPGDPFHGTEAAGFNDDAGELILTVRARVTGDRDGAQELLLRLMDVEDDIGVAPALMDDQTLNGLASSVYVEGPTGYRFYEDNPGSLLGVEWRVTILRVLS